MRCPNCNANDAFAGFMGINCPNPDCTHYKGAVVSDEVSCADEDEDEEEHAAISQSSVATAALTVKILSAVGKQNSILISFQADGDPGQPNKTVEIFWTLDYNTNSPSCTWKVCSLSNKNGTFVSGVDADGQTVYTTHWLCQLDGVVPLAAWKLKAEIN